MRIQVLSDIHLEFGLRSFTVYDSDLLVCAGDIHTGINGFKWISEQARDFPIIYVIGNHEYYRQTYPKLLTKLRECAKGTNVHLLENNSISLNGICFHGSTLWTDFDLLGDPQAAGFECQQKMNDYRLIRRLPTYSRLRWQDSLELHKRSLRWLENSLNNSQASKNVVISHHAPSMKSVPKEYQDVLVSAAYASNLDDFILRLEPDLWIHGHIHHSCDYYIGKSRIICNPAGYPGEGESGFKEDMIIEI